MAESQSHNDNHEHDDHDHGGLKKYCAVAVALFILTALSFAIGNPDSIIMKTKTIGWTGMMAISCAKAMLVILFFMHLKWEANWKYVLTIPASIMSIFLLLALIPDIGRRTHKYSQPRWLHAAEPDADHPAAWKPDESDAESEQPADDAAPSGESDDHH